MASKKPLVLQPPGIQQIQGGDTLGNRSSVVGSTSSPTSTGSSFVVIPEMTTTLTTQGGSLLAIFDFTVELLAGDNFSYAIFLDGSEVAGTRRRAQLQFSLSLGLLTFDNFQSFSTHALISPASGSRTVDVRWSVTSGTARAFSDQRRLTTIELF